MEQSKQQKRRDVFAFYAELIHNCVIEAQKFKARTEIKLRK